MTVVAFDVERHRREKLRRLERRNEFLQAELDRTYKLLADALQVAAGKDCDPIELLGVLGDMRGFNLATAAMHDQPRSEATVHELPRRREWTVDELVVLLRETQP